jgi:hypothetical protein
MAVIKYQLEDNGTIPSYITDGGYFPIGDDLIGIGSGGGTELSKSALHSYVMAQHNSSTYYLPTWRNNAVSLDVNMSDSEVTTMVNNWCTSKGIS